MILQALVQHYEDLSALGKISPPGWSRANVSFALSISRDGETLALSELTVEVQSGKKTVLRPMPMDVPEQVKRTVAVTSNFLCDNCAYILGVDAKGKPERALKCFEAAAELHTRILSTVEHPAARAVVRFFARGPQLEDERVLDKIDALIKGGNIAFRVDGAFVHEIPAVREAWQKAYASGDANAQGQCLITGQETEIAVLHPSIKGVKGAQATGAALVSFNARAYESYEKVQGENAPVGKYAAFAYGTALNYLLNDRQHMQFLGDMTIVFWAKGAQSQAQDMYAAFADMNPAPDEPTAMTDNDLMAAMKRLADGHTTNWDGAIISPDTPFYILALSPNAARLSIRFFLRDSFGKIAERMLIHQQNLEIVRPAYDKRQQLGFYALLQETVNQNARDKSASPAMSGELIRAVLTGHRYPATLLNGVMLRIRAERKVTRGRAAIIKAYYLKSPHKDCPKEVLTVSLNQSINVPYRLGRTFSLLEAIQQAANPGINTTITDKFFNSASSTPVLVFPILIRLARSHLRKLAPSLAKDYKDKLADLLSVVGDEFPARLTLPAQGSFQLGYYHQTQKRYEKKEKQDTEKQEKEEQTNV